MVIWINKCVKNQILKFQTCIAVAKPSLKNQIRKSVEIFCDAGGDEGMEMGDSSEDEAMEIGDIDGKGLPIRQGDGPEVVGDLGSMVFVFFP